MSCRLDVENEIIKAAAEGDLSAFDELVRRHSSRIFRLALAMLGNREDAADVQQEAFVKAYQKLGTFRGESSFGSWIYSIAARLCLSRRRKAAYKREELSEDILLRAGGQAPSPESAAIAVESAGQIRQSLSKMAPNDRLILVLRFIEQLDHKEIAEVLGCSVESSRSRLVRAKKLFRELYGEME